MQTRYLRTAEAAARLGLSPRTLEALRVRGGGPRYSRPGGRHIVVYDVRDLDAWVDVGRRATTRDPGAAVGGDQ